MSKNVNLEKPLSDEDRDYLNSRARSWEVEDNDRKFKKGKFADKYEEEFTPNYTVAAAPIEPGSAADNPPQFVGQRPYGVDRGVWGGSTGLSEQEALAGPAGEPHSTQVEEVDAEDLTVDELKDELRDRDLALDGNKADLVKRLKAAMKKEQ